MQPVNHGSEFGLGNGMIANRDEKDEKWVDVLIASGLSLSDLDRCFTYSSQTALNKLTRPFLNSTTAEDTHEGLVRKQLRRLTTGKTGVCSRDKYVRMRAIYKRKRPSAQ